MLDFLRGRRPQERAAADIDETLVRSAGGGISGAGALQAASELGAFAFAVGELGRCLALADVQPQEVRTRPLTPTFLASVGRGLVADGEAVYWIDALAGPLSLRPADSWDIDGDYRRESWRYHLSLPGPSYTSELRADGADVLHFQYGWDARQPWKGVGPLQAAGASLRLAGSLDAKLGLEIANAVNAYLIPTPGDPNDDRLKPIRKDLALMQGHTTMVPSMRDGVTVSGSLGPASAPSGDWSPKRLGANPPASLVELKKQSAADVLAACGILPSLFSDQGPATREAFRQYELAVVRPVAELVAAELSEKLEVEVTLDTRRVGAGDVQARARAAAALANAGLAVDDALVLAGIGD
ncbi:MAG: phage portal protein [Gemmatimonadales bacterium]|nr:phage portal protein [Candidatus Palauibacter ramosifaciens]